jgi:hypothetical protein
MGVYSCTYSCTSKTIQQRIGKRTDYFRGPTVPRMTTSLWRIEELGQLVKGKGLHVTATATAADIELVKGLGADKVIDYQG